MREAREQATFEKLFHDTRRDLLAYLLRRSDSAEDAADLFAETYLIAWRRLDAIPARDQARPWLFGVARKLLLKGASRRRSHNALVDRLAQEVRAARAAIAPADVDGRDALRSALEALPEIDREMLTLAAWEGLTPAEIATVIGRSPNVVRVRMHRARARLRLELGPGPTAARRAEYVAIEPDW
jgi:RNA polymerase sigma-70 factor (ECF subfamily)